MKIAVLLSGGVDSSVALALLREQGHEVTAFYLKIWLEDELSFLGSCPWQEDLSYAQAVCEQLGVPLEIVSLQQAYHDEVVSYTIAQIKRGYTPNPDMMCNQKIKFGAFWRLIADRGFDKIATGHYGKIETHGSLTILRQSPDPIKDQTYFLAQLSRAQLERLMLPLGHLAKTQVRELAANLGLATSGRKDSQGICFLGKISFRDFLRAQVGERPGPLIEYETGKQLGTHAGFWFYTIGQRQGLGLSGGPWYVVSKDPARNVVTISRTYDAPDKPRNRVYTGPVTYLCGTELPTRVAIKLRHGPEKIWATVHPDELQSGVVLTLDERAQGIAPGQFVVFYSADICLGSAQIEEHPL